MTLPSFTKRKGLGTIGLFLVLFQLALSLPTLFLLLRLGSDVAAESHPRVSIEKDDRQQVTVEDRGKEENGGTARVKVSVNRNFDMSDNDRAKCYGPTAGEIKEMPCIEGGIVVFDSWRGPRAVELVAFVFRPSDFPVNHPEGEGLSKRLTFHVEAAPKDCTMNQEGWNFVGNRVITVQINESFRPDVYGYMIDQSNLTFTVAPKKNSDNESCYPIAASAQTRRPSRQVPAPGGGERHPLCAALRMFLEDAAP